MNRGSSGRSCTLNPRPRSFNEAPIHESGKFREAASASLRTSGFNEAPIHESGKSHALALSVVRSLGFNEAPIHESGKCGRSPESTRDEAGLQ